MTGTSPFDLEPAVGAEPFHPEPSAGIDVTSTPEDERGPVRRVLCALAAPFLSPRFYYACGFLLTTFVLFAQFNPEFGQRLLGVQDLGWPWQLFQEADGGFGFDWTRPHGIVVALILIALGFLTAVFLPAGRSRGVWALIWSALAFVAFAPSGEELHILMFVIAGGLTAGALLMRRDGSRTSQLVLLFVVCLLASLLFMPLSSSELTEAGEEASAFRCQGIGTVESYGDLPVSIVSKETYTFYVHPTLQDWLPAGFWLRLDLFLASIPQTLMLLVFACGLFGLFGLGGRWAGGVASFLMFAIVIGVALILYHSGRGQPYWPTFTPHQGGLDAAANTLLSRYYAFLLPIIGGLADLGNPKP